MGSFERSYLNNLRRIVEEGEFVQDRTGVGTYSLFEGVQVKHDLSFGFPLLTTKKVFFRSVIVELLWFLRGLTNIGYLKERKVSIWDEWADSDGELGPIYGKQWRSFGGVDQVKYLIEGLQRDPKSRRLLLSAWNPADLPLSRLPPCHVLFQVAVREGRLHGHLYQRSADYFLGKPFNIASYALFLHLIAHQVKLPVGNLIFTDGDSHVYQNHLEQIRTQLTRIPTELPRLEINGEIDLISMKINGEDFDLNHFGNETAPALINLLSYTPQSFLAAPVAV